MSDTINSTEMCTFCGYAECMCDDVDTMEYLASLEEEFSNPQLEYELEDERLEQELHAKLKSGEVRMCYGFNQDFDGWWSTTSYYVAEDGSGFTQSCAAGDSDRDRYPTKLTAEEIKKALLKCAENERKELAKLEESKLRTQNSIRQLEEELAKLESHIP